MTSRRERVVAAAVLFCGLSFVSSCLQPPGELGAEEAGGAAGPSSGTGGSPTGNGAFSASGGARAAGESGGQGGSVAATGGAAATATGGATPTGGATATAGSMGRGGESEMGGTTATGQGGTSATGGTAGSAGTSTGGSTGGGTAGSGGTIAGGSMGTIAGGGAGGTAIPTGGAGGSSSQGSGGSTVSTAAGTIVPLYTAPTDASWNAIVTAAVAHPTVHVVAIINPNNGPGASKSSAYTSGIAALQAAHIEVIGYVPTGYGKNSLASVEAQIDQWKSFYPTMQGIFFDEQSTSTSDVAHYQTLSQYAKSKGLSHTVGNPGTNVPVAYIGAIDTMMIYESDGIPAVSRLAQWASYAPGNFGIIPYNVSAMDATFIKQARQYVGYVYLQNDSLPNPWDSLPSYFSALLAALE